MKNKEKEKVVGHQNERSKKKKKKKKVIMNLKEIEGEKKICKKNGGRKKRTREKYPKKNW